jgi:hypothetical protein
VQLVQWLLVAIGLLDLELTASASSYLIDILGGCCLIAKRTSSPRSVLHRRTVVVSAVGLPDRCMMRLGTGVAMCKARSGVRQPHYPPRDHPARVPAGTPRPASGGSCQTSISRSGLSGYAGRAWKGVLLRHMACITTASFRARAAAACLKPIRLARSRPQVLRAESCRTRISRLAAASKR